MKPRAKHILRPAAISVIMTLSLSTGTLAADDDEPIVIGQTEKPPMFHLDRPKASLLFEATRIVNDQSDQFSKSKSLEYRYDETATIGTTGYAVHPSVLNFDLSGTYGLTQFDLTDNEVHNSQDNTVYEYDTKFIFFEPRPLSGKLYARRDRKWINRTFGASLEEISESEGAALDLRKGRFSSHLEGFLTSSNLNAPGDPQQNFDYNETSLIWDNQYQITEHQELIWNYNFSDVYQNALNFANQTQRQDVDIEHNIKFGKEYQSFLHSTLHFLDQTGDFPQNYFRWDEHLRLHHSRELDTDYRYLLDRRQYGDLETMRNRGTVGFTHHLYQSLVTNGQIGAEYTSSGDGPGTQEYFGRLDFDYRKKVPYGLFNGGLGAGYTQRVTDAGATQPPVVDWVFIVPDNFQPIILTDPNLMPDTIAITDPSGLILYRQGVDYNVVTTGERTEIRPILGGAITPGNTVLIDYSFSAVPANTTDTANWNTNLRYTLDRGFFKGVSVYARYYQQQQTVSTDDPGAFIPNTYEDKVIGGEYRNYGFTFQIERESRTGEIYPFDARRFSAKWEGMFWEDMRFMLNSSYTLMSFPDSNNESKLLTVSAQLQQNIGEHVSMAATALWRNEEDKLFGDSTGWEEQLEMTWKYRQTTLYVRARNSSLRSDDEDSDYQQIQIGIERQL